LTQDSYTQEYTTEYDDDDDSDDDEDEKHGYDYYYKQLLKLQNNHSDDDDSTNDDDEDDGVMNRKTKDINNKKYDYNKTEAELYEEYQQEQEELEEESEVEESEEEEEDDDRYYYELPSKKTGAEICEEKLKEKEESIYVDFGGKNKGDEKPMMYDNTFLNHMKTEAELHEEYVQQQQSSSSQNNDKEEEEEECWSLEKKRLISSYKQQGYSLKYCTNEIWKRDRDVVLAAVSSCGDVLEFACEELRNDKEIVLAAVQNDWHALQYARRTTTKLTRKTTTSDEK